ncbi:MAG: hypothetical protein JJ894_06880 [Dinoroseobacter sp.]|nr:hypothetical protein [Dinoroseobacter sp.]
MRWFPLLLFFFYASPSLGSEDVLSAEEFDALATGKTLFFSRHGNPYGAEEYRRDRSVIWSFLNGECQYGRWMPGPDQSICFVYEFRPNEPICWSFFRENGDIQARVLGAAPEDDLTLMGESRGPLECQGPDVGV